MKTQSKEIADLISLYFAGKPKTGKQLREAIRSLANTTLFHCVSEADIEEIARHNEATQGIHFGFID